MKIEHIIPLTEALYDIDNDVDFIYYRFFKPITDAIDNVIQIIPSYQRKRFINEFSPSKIKASIQHELSHWIDDSLHNRHISKLVRRANESPDYYKIISQNKGSTFLTNHEIDAQVQSVKQLKRGYDGNWDEVTLDDLRDIHAPFDTIFNKLDSDLMKVWKKTFLKRLSREGLLSKAMVRGF